MNKKILYINVIHCFYLSQMYLDWQEKNSSKVKTPVGHVYLTQPTFWTEKEDKLHENNPFSYIDENIAIAAEGNDIDEDNKLAENNKLDIETVEIEVDDAKKPVPRVMTSCITG